MRQNIYKPAREVHHLERHEGDAEKFFSGQLESLCKPCHSSITAQEVGWHDEKRVTPPGQKSFDP